MGAKNKAANAGATVVALRNSPYVQRLAEDEELRQNLWSAYDSARSAVARIQNGKQPTTKQLFDDKKLQRDIRAAAESFRDASVALREAPKRKSGGGAAVGRLLLLAIVGAGVALGVSEGLRKKVLDALFGAEEEFEYTSTTAPVTPVAATGPTGSETTGAASTTTSTEASTSTSSPSS